MYYFSVLLTVTRLLFETVPVLSAPSSVAKSESSWPPGKLGYDLGVNIASGFEDKTAVAAIRTKMGPDFVKVRVASEDGLIKDVIIGDKSFIGQLLEEYYPELDAYLKQRHYIGNIFPSGRFGYDLGVNIASGFDDNTSVVAVQKDDGPDFVKVRINDYNAQTKDVLIGDKSFIGRPLKEYYPALADYLKQQHGIPPSM